MQHQQQQNRIYKIMISIARFHQIESTSTSCAKKKKKKTTAFARAVSRYQSHLAEDVVPGRLASSLCGRNKPRSQCRRERAPPTKNIPPQKTAKHRQDRDRNRNKPKEEETRDTGVRQEQRQAHRQTETDRGIDKMTRGKNGNRGTHRDKDTEYRHKTQCNKKIQERIHIQRDRDNARETDIYIHTQRKKHKDSGGKMIKNGGGRGGIVRTTRPRAGIAAEVGNYHSVVKTVYRIRQGRGRDEKVQHLIKMTQSQCLVAPQ